jgi:hypothetical protein
MLTSEYRVHPYVRDEGLGYSFLDVYSPCYPSLEDDTEIFDTTYKCDVPSIHLKVILRHSTSFREVVHLSLPFIELYVPALTP